MLGLNARDIPAMSLLCPDVFTNVPENLYNLEIFIPQNISSYNEDVTFLFIKDLFVFIFMSVLPECMFVHHVCAWSLGKREAI